MMAFLDGERYKRLEELLGTAKPYQLGDKVTDERTKANMEFMQLSYELLPDMLRYIKRVQSILKIRNSQ